ncbi:hypothetical protein [Streptomyces sp. NPDC093589]|uniref:hypothetical protein n=1 Tax=Streptomyces sp. NPDC093589 TaxID=3366043 RepID=UPI003827C3A5
MPTLTTDTPVAATPEPTAGTMLRDALAQYGITEDTGLVVNISPFHSSYDVPVPLPRDQVAHLVTADRDYSAEHPASAHTGWSIFLHDEHGDPLGDPLYITGGVGLVDCARDCAAAAAFLADFLTTPVSRHCDCYTNERPGRRHDPQCNRYANPRLGQAAA